MSPDEKEAEVSYENLRRLGRVLLFAIAFGLVTVTGYLAGRSTLGPRAQGLSDAHDGLVRFDTSLYGLCEVLEGRLSHEATVIVSPRPYVPGAASMTVGIRLCFPDNLMEQIRATHGRHERATIEPSAKPPVFRARSVYSRVPVTVSLNYLNGGALDQLNRPVNEDEIGQASPTVTFGSLVRPRTPIGSSMGMRISGGPVSVATVRIPVASDPSQFPLDWYSALFVTSVQLGTGARTAPIGDLGQGRQNFQSSILPTRVVVVPPNQTTTRLTAQVQSGGSSVVRLTFRRPPALRLFVLIITLLPGIMGVLFGIALLVRREGLGLAGLAPLAATLLTVLPIRTVLVPDDLSSLTLVDYLLGFEMAFIASIALLGVARDVRDGADTEWQRFLRVYKRRSAAITARRAGLMGHEVTSSSGSSEQDDAQAP